MLGYEYDVCTLPTWLGRLSPREAELAIVYGCGGVISILADYHGSKPPMDSTMVHMKPGAHAFTSYSDAVDGLVIAQRRGNALLIAVQTGPPLLASPVFRETTEFDPALIDTATKPLNFAALIKSDNGPTWTWANHGARGFHYKKDPMFIRRRETLPGPSSGYNYTFYCVIPDSRDNSPVVPQHQLKPLPVSAPTP